jgi:uncharacterized protein YjcR
MAKDGKKK